jgi:arabinofuranan 3-O-arabinosyltransferase
VRPGEDSLLTSNLAVEAPRRSVLGMSSLLIREENRPPGLDAADFEPIDAPAACQDPLSRRVLAGISVGFLVLAFGQSWGLIEDDTKLPFIMTPVSYFASALHLWNQTVFGGTANPTAGYLFPMEEFFIVTNWLHIPTWCAERLWLALLLTVGCWGVVRLAEALGIGVQWARVLAGVAYSVSPIVFTWVSTSVALLAVVMLPWVLAPLVVGSREGSPRRAAARSGVAIALMGGVNAAVVLATLPVPLIWFVTRKRGARRAALAAWWLLAVVLACFWWTVPVTFVGKYGFNYLPYTETSALTTSTASAFESVRGASFWVNYFNIGGPLIRAAWLIVSGPLVIVGTSILAALGLAGLCRRIPERLFLISVMAFGVVVMASGYVGSFGGPGAHTIQTLLQGPLAPFRNISKFTPDVELPLVLGLAWFVSMPRWRTKSALTANHSRTALVRSMQIVAVVAVIVAAVPFLRGEGYKTGGFAAIPNYWYQAGQWLDTHQGHANALVVPGAAFGDYTWGDPTDEPLQVTSSTSVEWRNIIPLASTGYVQMLDAVDEVLDNGLAQPGLAAFLARGGIDYIVERNDLNLQETQAPPPAQVHQVLSESPGLTQVAAFGPHLSSHQVHFTDLPVYDSPGDLDLRAVEIFRVDRSTSIVQTYPARSSVVVSGDVSSLLPLSAAGFIEGKASVLAGDSLAAGVAKTDRATWAITDGNQLRDVGFGGIRNNVSYLLGPGQTAIPRPGGVPRAFIVVPGTQHETIEAPIGAASVSASSFGATPLFSQPSAGPASAFDGLSKSGWTADAANDSVGQWVSIRFTHPKYLSSIHITPVIGSAQQPTVRYVKITTDRGSVVRYLPVTNHPVRLTVAPGITRDLKITIESVRAASEPARGGIILSAGISDIQVPGINFRENMKVPDDESRAFSAAHSAPPIITFTRPLTNANLSLGISATDDPYMARTFSIPRTMTAVISGTAVPVPGGQLESALSLIPQASGPLEVSANAWLGSLPRFRPENLIDGTNSPWIAALGDDHPELTLTFDRPIILNSMTLTPTPLASRPTQVLITDGHGYRAVVRVPDNGRISFPAVATDKLTVHITRARKLVTPSPFSGVQMTVPPGLSSIRVPGIPADKVIPRYVTQPIKFPCGTGPELELDGKRIPTTVNGTLGDLLNLEPMNFSTCGTTSVRLAAGSHQFETQDPSNSTALFEVNSVAIYHPQNDFLTSSSGRSVRIDTWGPEYRTVSVDSGPTTVLVVAQNYNAGWDATLGNKALVPVRIDGWEQGYIVPAGSGGVIHLTMAPDRLFRFLLLFGGMLLIVLFAMALVRGKTSSMSPLRSRQSPPPWVVLIAEGIILFAIAGALCIIAIPIWILTMRLGRVFAALTALVAFLAAGIAAALHPAALHASSAGAGALGPFAQFATVIALSAVLSSLAIDRSEESLGNGQALDRFPEQTAVTS